MKPILYQLTLKIKNIMNTLTAKYRPIMKYSFFIILLLLFIESLQAQAPVGKWNINSLIGDNYSADEYVLLPVKNQEFGHILILNPDGTFRCYRIPGCGQDRYPPSTYGNYTIIDKNYISFLVTKKNEQFETLVNQELGKYYYFQKDGGFTLLKSTGNIEQDKQISYFRDLLYQENNEINKYEDNALNWKYTEIVDEKEAVLFCLEENQTDNAEILYSKYAEGYNRTIILIKVDNEFRYIVFEKDYHRKGRNRIALYDNYLIKKTDKLITEINNDRNLKKKIISDNNEPKQNIVSNSDIRLTLYYKKNKLQKGIYDQYTSYSTTNGNVNNITIYFQNEEPIYIEYITKHITNQKERESITGFYILDFKNHKFMTKLIKKENGKNSYPGGLVNKVIDEIKKQPK